MELPSKSLEQIAFNTRPKIEEHILIVMDKSTHEEHLSQPLQTNIKQFKIAVTFLTGFNGIFNGTDKNNEFNFTKPYSDKDGLIQITLPAGACEIESLNNEMKRIIIDDEDFTETNYPFKIKPNFSTLGSFLETSQQKSLFSFLPNDSIGELLGFKATTIDEKYNLSPNPVDILSFDNLFLECDFAKGMIYWGKRSGIHHNWTKTVDLAGNYVEFFTRVITWYMMESKDIISSICFK